MPEPGKEYELSLVAGRTGDLTRRAAGLLATDDASDLSLSGTVANRSDEDSELETRGLRPGLAERPDIERCNFASGAAFARPEVGLGITGLRARSRCGEVCEAVATDSPCAVDGRPAAPGCMRGCPSNPFPFG